MDKFQVGPWLVAPKLNSLSCNGHTVRIEPKAMQVLVRLAEEKGDPVSKEELIRSVWADTFVTDDVLTRSISELRKAFGDDSRNSHFIETIPRGGYRLASPVVPIEPEQEKGAEVTASGASHRGKFLFRVAWAIAVMLAALLTIAVTLWFRPAPIQPPSVRAFLPPPTDWTFGPWQLALSPDGSKVAFRAAHSGNPALWIQSLATGTPIKVSDTNSAVAYFWSPDGRYIGFCNKEALAKVDAAGGPVVTIAEEKDCNGGSWNRDGTIVFAGHGKILRVASSGGPVTEVLHADAPPRAQGPSFLPDGRHFLFMAKPPGLILAAEGARYAETAVYVGDLNTGEHKFLFALDQPMLGPATAARYAAPGFLLFIKGDSLMAQRFDPSNLSLHGDPAAIAHIYGAFSVTESGVLAFFNMTWQQGLLWYSRDGKLLGQLGPPDDYYGPRLSPDGQHLAIAINDHVTKIGFIWVFDIARGTATRVTSQHEDYSDPVWSPDGKRLAFAAFENHIANIHTKVISGLGNEESLFPSKQLMFPDDWSADGRYIAYTTRLAEGKYHLGTLQLTPEKKTTEHLRTEFSEDDSRFSPDFKWLAYTSNESGIGEVYVVPFPPSVTRWKVSTNGGTQPSWRRDGKELFYLAPDRKIMSVAVTVKGDSLEFGKPVALFETRATGIGLQYDVTGDGQKFIVNSDLRTVPDPMTIITNWTALLKK